MARNFNMYVEKMLDRIVDRINTIHMALETALVRPDIDQWPRQIISDLYFNKTFIADPEKVDGFYEQLFNLFIHKRVCCRVISAYDIISFFVDSDEELLKLESLPNILKRLMYNIDSDESMFKLMDHIEAYSCISETRMFNGEKSLYTIRFGLPYNFMVKKAKRPRVEHLPSKVLYLEKPKEEKVNGSEE